MRMTTTNEQDMMKIERGWLRTTSRFQWGWNVNIINWIRTKNIYLWCLKILFYPIKVVLLKFENRVVI